MTYLLKFLQGDSKRDDEDFNKATMRLKILLTSSIWAQKGLNAERGTKPPESEVLENQRDKTVYVKAAVLAECSGNGVRAATLPPQHKWSFQDAKIIQGSRGGLRPVTRPTCHTHISLSISSMYSYLKRNLPLTPAGPTNLSLHVSLYFSCSN